jgi:hypothetical protein
VARAIFPLDEQLGLNETVYRGEMAKQMVWLSALLPYDHGEQVFARIGERLIPASSIWRQTQRHGERLAQQVEKQRQQVSFELVKLPDAVEDHDQRKGVTMDGGMVNIRGEGWRELKVGAIFNIEQRLERDPQTQLLTEHAHAAQARYTASFGGKAVFATALWALAVEQAIPTAKASCVCADGAGWIWSVADEYFPVTRLIVDWFHAVQHLAQAASTLYPDDEAKRHRWFNLQRDRLYLGNVEGIITSFEEAGLASEVGYFRDHQRRMQYLEFREEGYPIGSGTVESGVKQFKQRLTGPGMRWEAQAAARMVILRSAALGHHFDALWDAA